MQLKMGYCTALIKTTTIVVVGCLALITGVAQAQPQGELLSLNHLKLQLITFLFLPQIAIINQ